MPGVAYHFTVLRRAVDALASGSAADQAKASILKKNSEFAHLGALGPDLLSFVPVDPARLDEVEASTDPTSLPLATQLALYRNPTMVAYAMMFRKILDIWPILDELNAFLDTMDAIAAAEDLDALKAQKDASEAIKAQVATLTSLSGDATTLKAQIETMIASAIPPIQKFPWSANGPSRWRDGEYLAWRRTGKFARRLTELAEDSGDDRLKAFAYGWLGHVGAAVTGEPFINQIVGGPYRTHWWRNRYVRNYVDAWTWGYYNTTATITNDEPAPPYTQWASISCGANLHTSISLSGAPTGPEAAKAVAFGGLPEVLPTNLLDLIQKALDEVYAGAPKPDDLDASAFQRAYVGALGVLWFMSSGQGAMCPKPVGAPPSTCSTPPDWVTSGGTPPTPDPDVEVDPANTASAIVLAIIAIIAFLCGAWVAGAAAIAGAIAAAVAGLDIDWDELRCDLYWMRKVVFDGMNAIRSLLVEAGLAYPLNWELGQVGTDGLTTPALDRSGRPLTRTRGKGASTTGAGDIYPHLMDASLGTAGINYLFYPVSGLEGPSTGAWPPDTLHYANAALSDLPLENGGVLGDDGSFPTRDRFFGASVPNAVQVISAGGEGLVDYNLHGDRGYGWKTWNPTLVGGTPTNPPINNPVPEP